MIPAERIPTRRLTAEAAALWEMFPPRTVAASWAAAQASRVTVVSRAMTCPYAAAENDQSRYFRRLGIIRMLDWLEAQPGGTWQDRWLAGCRAAADRDWRDTAELWLKGAGRIAADNRTVWRSLGGTLGLLIGCDVIRPDLGWLLTSATPAIWPPIWPVSGTRTGSPRCRRSPARHLSASHPLAGQCSRSLS